MSTAHLIVTINREALDRLLEAHARLLFSAAATVRHVESFLEHCSDDGSLDEDQAREVRYVLHGVQQLIEDTTGKLELACLEQDAARIAATTQGAAIETEAGLQRPESGARRGTILKGLDGGRRPQQG